MKMVAGRAASMSALGILIGVAGSLALSSVVESMLYGVKPTNPAAMIGVVVLLLLIGLLGAALPALRGLHVSTQYGRSGPGNRAIGRMDEGIARVSVTGGLLRKERKDRELAEELECHLQMQIEANLRSGMTPAEARRAALLKSGGVELAKEECRDRRGMPVLETTLRDLRHASGSSRVVRRSPWWRCSRWRSASAPTRRSSRCSIKSSSGAFPSNIPSNSR